MSAFVTFEGPNQDPVVRAVGDIPIAVYIVFAVASGALLWRRHKPLVVLGVNLVASALSWGLCDSHCHVYAVMFSLYSVGRYATNERWSYIGVGGTIALWLRSTTFAMGSRSRTSGSLFSLCSSCGTSAGVSGFVGNT